ncbi:MAG TPA: efflux transporter outer membrane subunit, partial [Humisphaera sp.]|nr:efflux transporter outer membrane subunit [Humisphaera sp.]
MIAAFALAGCTVGPDYHRPAVEVPGQFNAAATQPAASQPATTQAAATQPVVDLRRWWETFNDPALNRLIVQATASNLDVRLAAARVREARAQVLFNRAALFPTLDSSAEYSRNQLSKNAFGANAASSATTGATATGTPSLPGRTDLYRAGFDAGWELDVFGGTRRAIEAAQYTLEAQVEARRSALVTLLSEVAQNYIMLRGFQHELAIVQNNVAAQRDTLDLTRTRLQAGIATSLDVARSEAQVASTESQVPTLQTQIKQALERLAVLLNRTSADLEAELAPEAQLPGGPPQVPAGLPSELLRRRPDVRQAERQFAAATANIGVATADLFPKFNLTGSLGLESLQLKTFANSSSLFWS